MTTDNIEAYHTHTNNKQQPKNHKKLTKKQQQKLERTQKTDSQSITPLNNRTVDSCRTQTTQNKKISRLDTTTHAGQLFKLAPKILPQTLLMKIRVRVSSLQHRFLI